MIDKLRALANRYDELQQKLQDPAVSSDPKQLKSIGKEMKDIAPLLSLLRDYEAARQAIEEEKKTTDPDLRELAREEAETARIKILELEGTMKQFLVPKDPDDDKSVILEVRAGAGGDEAALFAGELVRMYLRYCESKRWKTEFLSQSAADAGGIKDASFKIDGTGIYGRLKYESGVHRVQRIPETEAKGRVHTSTATVAILPEAEEVDIQIRPEDLRIDTFRSGGAGGQNVNKVESAIRITHIPTGTVVACQTERSQLRNRQLAMQLLRSRIYASKQEKLAKERGQMRSGQIGTGDRSEKIRTYNFPQDRLTDHRLDQNFSNLPAIMEGDLDGVFDALREKDTVERLSAIMV